MDTCIGLHVHRFPGFPISDKIAACFQTQRQEDGLLSNINEGWARPLLTCLNHYSLNPIILVSLEGGPKVGSKFATTSEPPGNQPKPRPKAVPASRLSLTGRQPTPFGKTHSVSRVMKGWISHAVLSPCSKTLCGFLGGLIAFQKRNGTVTSVCQI